MLLPFSTNVPVWLHSTQFKPQHQLPCLLHKGQTIREAKVIIVYLLEWFDKDSRLYSPENTEKFSMILYIISFNENTLKPLCEDIFNEVRTKGDRGLRNFGERADNAFGTLETILSKQQYLASDTDLTIADLTILGTITGIGVVFRVHRDIRWPAIGVWYEKLRCRPSFEHAMLPAVDIFTAYFQTLVTSQNCNT